MFAAEIAPLGAFVDVAVFDQGGGLLGGSGAEIQSHERLGASGFAPLHEFIGAELVGIHGIPRFVEHARAVLLGPDSVEPVVSGDKVAARITNDWNAEFANFVHHVFAKAVRVGKLRSGLVDAFVDGASQMLEEGAEEIAVDGSNGPASVHQNARWLAGTGRRLGGQQAPER